MRYTIGPLPRYEDGRSHCDVTPSLCKYPFWSPEIDFTVSAILSFCSVFGTLKFHFWMFEWHRTWAVFGSWVPKHTPPACYYWLLNLSHANDFLASFTLHFGSNSTASSNKSLACILQKNKTIQMKYQYRDTLWLQHSILWIYFISSYRRQSIDGIVIAVLSSFVQFRFTICCSLSAGRFCFVFFGEPAACSEDAWCWNYIMQCKVWTDRNFFGP